MPYIQTKLGTVGAKQSQVLCTSWSLALDGVCRCFSYCRRVQDSSAFDSQKIKLVGSGQMLVKFFSQFLILITSLDFFQELFESWASSFGANTFFWSRTATYSTGVHGPGSTDKFLLLNEPLIYEPWAFTNNSHVRYLETILKPFPVKVLSTSPAMLSRTRY